MQRRAKTKDYADRIGNHQHCDAQAPSPPGYWGPNFPDTQQVIDNRKAGEEMEKEMVEERWGEAMEVAFHG